MLERGANSWFYSCETRAQREKEKRTRWLSEALMRYKEQLVKDFHLGQVLPYLVYDGVFSLKEYREIISQDRYPERVECFLLTLFSKGPDAFCAFCSHLEEFSPYLLTSLFLYYQETQRILQDVLVAEEAARLRAQLDPRNDTEDQEQRAQLFPKYKLPKTKNFHKLRIQTRH
ncbi:DEATH-like containing protein [Cricetulus griseus]|nr:DEATH-like containing protein [Cricetulus griseus]